MSTVRAMSTHSSRCLTGRLGPGPTPCCIGTYASVLVRVSGDVGHELLGSQGKESLSACKGWIRGPSATQKGDSQSDILALEPYALQIVVCDLIRDLHDNMSTSLLIKSPSVWMCWCHKQLPQVETYQGLVIVQHEQKFRQRPVLSCLLSSLAGRLGACRSLRGAAGDLGGIRCGLLRNGVCGERGIVALAL